MQAELNTVYQRLEVGTSSRGGRELEGSPTIEVRTGPVDLYVANTIAEPADETEMTFDSTLAPGIHVVEGRTKWIFFLDGTDTAEVWVCGII